MATYKFSLYTESNILFKEFDSLAEFCMNVSNNFLNYFSCTLKITNTLSNKEYDPITIKEISYFFNKNIDFDKEILTTYNISPETDDSTYIPIDLLYFFIGRIRYRLYTKYMHEIIYPIKQQLQEDNIDYNAQNSIFLLKNLSEVQQTKLKLLGYQDDDNILNFVVEEYASNKQLFEYLRTFEIKL